MCQNYSQTPGCDKKLDRMNMSVTSNPEKSIFIPIQLYKILSVTKTIKIWENKLNVMY